MKYSLASLAGALAAVLCGSACAQSAVTVYGLVDLNVGTTSHTTPQGGTALRIQSGGMNTSRLGFTGKEELGNGLRAVYGLEMGIAADTGVADAPLFKRQATVGLEGRLGSLTFGRAFTSVYDFVLPYDPMGYAPMYSWAPAGNASGDSKYGMALAFDNMVKYAGKAGKFAFGASYGAGEEKEGAKLAVAGNYADGPYSVVATWERIGAAAGIGETRVWHLGALAGSGRWKLQAALRDYRQDAAGALPRLHARLYWFGANYALTPRTTLTGAAYLQDEPDAPTRPAADPRMLVVRVKHALSPRTDLYATAALAKAAHGRLVSLARDEAGFGSSQRSIVAGVQHRF